MEPNNALVAYFLAVEVYRPMKKQKKVAQMYIEALNRTENLVLDRPFKVGEEYVNNVHEAIKLEGQKESNEGVELFGNNKKTKAIAKFELSTKLVPGFVQPYISLSTIAMADEKYDKALDYINEGLKIENSNELNTRKAECLSQKGNYDDAIAILNSIKADNELMQINIDKQIFNITLEKENYDEAAILGDAIVEKMFITLGIDELEIARTCYNVAFCNYSGNIKHQKALEILNSGTEDKSERTEALSLAEEAVEYYKLAKEDFMTHLHITQTMLTAQRKQKS